MLKVRRKCSTLYKVRNNKSLAWLCGLGFRRFCTIAIYLENTKGLEFRFLLYTIRWVEL